VKTPLEDRDGELDAAKDLVLSIILPAIGACDIEKTKPPQRE
jgi:hypothetical protein